MKPKTDIELQREIVCLHEAAHALIFWHQGFNLEQVTVAPEERFLGTVKAKYTGEGCKILPVESAVARIKAKMAGRIVIDLTYPEKNSGYDQDMADIVQELSDDHEWYEIIRWIKAHSSENMTFPIEAFYQEFSGTVADILKSPEGNRTLHALADALDLAGTLSGAAAAEIMALAWGDPLPLKALPVSSHMSITNTYPKTFNDLIKRLSSHTSLMLDYVKHVRCTGTEEENLRMNQIHQKLLFLKILFLD